ncbi:MAG: D-alanine--D-alanine ligase family protein [Candidatus Xenobia bacterium]
MMRRRIALLFGGRSAEHDISLLSARFVASTLDPERYDVVPIGISREGRWSLPAAGMKALETGDISGLPVVPSADRGLVPQGAEEPPIDVVFPVLHGPFGEDGTMQGLLELAGIPYVGAGVLGSSIGMDKGAQKGVLVANGIPTPRFVVLRRSEWEMDQAGTVKRLEERFGYPVFVKPANLGSSVGITKAHHRQELEGALQTAGEYDLRIVVEEALEGIREIEVAVIGNEVPEVSVPGEIKPTHEFYSYEAKYLDEHGAALEIPAKLEPEMVRKIQDLARRTFLALDLCGLSRVDFFVRGSDVWVNEVNTIPGFTPISMFPRLWEASGLPPRQLMERLIELALERNQARRALKTAR